MPIISARYPGKTVQQINAVQTESALGRHVRLTDENYALHPDDRSIALVSTDSNTYAIDITASGQYDGQTVDIYMAAAPTSSGSFTTTGGSLPVDWDFSRMGEHLQITWDAVNNSWRPISTSGETTRHLNVGRIGTPTTGTPGVATPAALAVFGQMNIHKPLRIAFSHLHLIVDASSGSAVMELWRLRSGTPTLIANLTYTPPTGNYVTAPFVFVSGDARNVVRNDYILCQVTTATAFTAGGAEGVTIDVHFEDQLIT